ncbi:hypothetical protein WR25_12467 [Diploscapter pachys]|uniref:F-box domain-containing protein n=1 Tax=Diploscapter pachys TaxID=2018661 RepID=A0A2A2KD85_9BILA|nr:hypothetical protein WR25_12467 [Diploscapter pachys]
MLANLPVEIILLICEYPEFKDLGQLAWTNKRTMQIIKRHLPMALERKTLFYRPDPPEWRNYASVTYFKDKLYYLGGKEPKTEEYTNRIDLLMDIQLLVGGIVIKYIDYQTMDGNGLNDRGPKSCLCFDPSAPVDNRISRTADMSYARHRHSLVAANGKLYTIGGRFQEYYHSSKNGNEPGRSRKSNWHNSQSTRMDLKGKDSAQRSKSRGRNRNTRMELDLDRPKRIGSTD